MDLHDSDEDFTNMHFRPMSKSCPTLKTKRSRRGGVLTKVASVFGFKRSKDTLRQENDELCLMLSNVNARLGKRDEKLRNALARLDEKDEELRNAQMRLDEKDEELRNAQVRLDEKDEELRNVQLTADIYTKKLKELIGKEEHSTVINWYIQTGDDNNISVQESPMLNELLLSYHEGLEKSVQDRDKLIHRLEQAQATVDRIEEGLMQQTRMNQEMVECLTQIKEKTPDKDLDIAYTISLANPRLVEDFIEILRSLSDLPPAECTFNSLPDKAKVGVMRLMNKYCKYGRSLTLESFSRELGITGEVTDSDNLQHPLREDDCACLLFRWVNMSPENDAKALVDIFPRIKHHGIVRGFNGYERSVGSLFSFENQSELIREVKDTINSGYAGIQDKIASEHVQTRMLIESQPK